MSPLRSALGVVLLLLSVLVVACAAPTARSSAPPSHARCLYDPTETGTRPLFFLFCVQSP